MRSVLAISLFLLLTVSGTAQNQKHINIDIGLMQVHQDFFKLFDGILDLGGNYNREIVPNLYGGIDFHVGFLRRVNTTNRATAFKPGLILNYHFLIAGKVLLIPQAKIGYGFVRISNSEFDYVETQSGWNPGGELRVQWKRETLLDYYVFGRLEAIHFSKDESFTRLDHYRHVYLTSFGLGVHLKSGAGK